MRKFGFVILASVLAAGLFGCKNNVKDEMSANAVLERKLSKILPADYTNIGKKHNELLNDFYFKNRNRSISPLCIDYKTASAEDYFGTFDIEYTIRACTYEYVRNITTENTSDTQFMLNKELVSETSGKYMALTEKVLANPLDSLDATQAAISNIELQALHEQKNSEELCSFLSYAETAKTSLEFWSENIETLESSMEKHTSEGRWIFRSLWNRYKHKLAMMAASDAAGAAAGAAAGYAIAGPHGAAVGAGIAGASSSHRRI